MDSLIECRLQCCLSERIVVPFDDERLPPVVGDSGRQPGQRDAATQRRLHPALKERVRVLREPLPWPFQGDHRLEGDFLDSLINFLSVYKPVRLSFPSA